MNRTTKTRGFTTPPAPQHPHRRLQYFQENPNHPRAREEKQKMMLKLSGYRSYFNISKVRHSPRFSMIKSLAPIQKRNWWNVFSLWLSSLFNNSKKRGSQFHRAPKHLKMERIGKAVRSTSTYHHRGSDR